MDKLNPTTVIKYSYLIAFGLFIIAGLVSSNIFLLGLTIFLIGALLAGAQSSLLPLAAMFYPARLEFHGCMVSVVSVQF